MSDIPAKINPRQCVCGHNFNRHYGQPTQADAAELCRDCDCKGYSTAPVSPAAGETEQASSLIQQWFKPTDEQKKQIAKAHDWLKSWHEAEGSPVVAKQLAAYTAAQDRQLAASQAELREAERCRDAYHKALCALSMGLGNPCLMPDEGRTFSDELVKVALDRLAAAERTVQEQAGALAKALRLEAGDEPNEYFIPAEPEPIGPCDGIVEAAHKLMEFSDRMDKKRRDTIAEQAGEIERLKAEIAAK